MAKNFIKHSGHVYSVKNQNALNQALYDFDPHSSKKEVRHMLQNWPNKYPATIVIINQSFECGRIYVEELDLGEAYHSTAGLYQK